MMFCRLKRMSEIQDGKADVKMVVEVKDFIIWSREPLGTPKVEYKRVLPNFEEEVGRKGGGIRYKTTGKRSFIGFWMTQSSHCQMTSKGGLQKN